LFLSLSADETQASSAKLSKPAYPVGSSVFRFSAGVYRNNQPLFTKIASKGILTALYKDCLSNYIFDISPISFSFGVLDMVASTLEAIIDTVVFRYVLSSLSYICYSSEL